MDYWSEKSKAAEGRGWVSPDALPFNTLSNLTMYLPSQTTSLRLSRVLNSLILCLGIVFFAPAWGKSNEQKMVRVGVSIVEPWKYVENGKLVGAEIDLFDAIAHRLHMQAVYEELPFKRALVYMKNGEIDVLFGLLRTHDRERYIEYIDPPYKKKSNKAFYVVRGGEHIINTHEDLYGLTVGAKIGVRYFHKFDTDTQIKKVEVSTYQQNIEKLLHGRIDVFICTDSQGDYLIQSLGLNSRISKSPYCFTQNNPAYIGISKKSSLLGEKEKMEAVLRTMVKEGEVSRIFDNFFVRNGLQIPDYK